MNFLQEKCQIFDEIFAKNACDQKLLFLTFYVKSYLEVRFGAINISRRRSSLSFSANIFTISGKKPSESVSYNSRSVFFFDFLYFSVKSSQSWSVKHATDHVDWFVSVSSSSEDAEWTSPNKKFEKNRKNRYLCLMMRLWEFQNG